MTPAVMINGIACIPSSLKRLKANELRDAACRTDGKVRLNLPKADTIRMLMEEGYRRAVNPGTGIILIKF